MEPATLVWSALAVTALAADAVLIRHGHRTLSAVAGTPLGRFARHLLAIHFDSALPVDLLAAIKEALR